jgi:serine/threonine protein kinase/tetratricopeptide (TPR) repeat protein
VRQVGRYVVLDELAQGGMATVHIGKLSAEGGFSRVVAIKQLHANFARDADFRSMFLDEARLVARIRHAHVVSTLDVIEQDGDLFIVMEYVHGPSLARVVRDLRGRSGSMPVGVAVSIVADALEGLHAAHEARSEVGAPLRIVHRDVSPPNIIVGTDGIGRVLDFGVAHAADRSGCTVPGLVKGKPSYMAPEQAQGEDVDRRVDVYAASAVLWELLVGERVFQAESAAGLMLRHVHETPEAPSRRRRDGISAELDALVLRGLAKRPDERFATARQMAEALDEVVERPSRAEVGAWLDRTESTFFAERDELLARIEPRTDAAVSKSTPDAPPLARGPSPWPRRGALAAAVAIAAVAASSGVLATSRRTQEAAFPAAAASAPGIPTGTARAPVKLLVPDFANTTGDPAFDPALGTLFREIINDSPETITGFSKRATAIARTLRADDPTLGATGIDDRAWTLAAGAVGAPGLVLGSVTTEGAGYRVRVRIVEPLGGGVWLDLSGYAASPDATLGIAADMALAVRETLGDTSTPEQRTRAGDAFRFTSVAAAAAYGRACDATQNGSWDVALREAGAAVAADPSFAMGQFALALAYGNAGRLEDAERTYRAVLAHIDRLSEANRLMASGLYFTVRREPAKAVEQLTQYVERYPANFGGAMDLANATFAMRDMQGAVREGRRAYGLGNAPIALANLSLYEAYAGEFDASVRDAKQVVTLGGDTAETAIVALAHAELGLGSVGDAHEAYADLAKRGATPASRAALGEADIALAEGRLVDAERILQDAIAADSSAGASDLAHVKQAVLAETHLRMGKRADALDEAARVAAASRDLAVLVPVARMYATARADRAGAALVGALRARVDPDAQSYAALVEGEALLAVGRARDALARFEAAQKLADTWLVRLDLGRAYLALDLYPEAYQELDACTKRRGEALALFLDDTPTYRYWTEAVDAKARAEKGLATVGR